MTSFEEEIHLCLGTFLTLLMNAKNEVANAHEKEKGISSDSIASMDSTSKNSVSAVGAENVSK